MTNEAIDYDELIDRIIQDCGMNEICEDVSNLSDELLKNRAISEQQYNTLMSLVNRVGDRLDKHMENQAIQPAREVNELKKWMKEYLDGYISSNTERMKKSEDEIRNHHLEIFGNGKRGLRTEIESLKTKATITLWLVGILLTGGGLSAGALIAWQFIFGGMG